RELNPASKRAISIESFATAYRDAAGVATLRSLEAGSPDDASEVDGVAIVPVAIDVQTVAFGPVEGDLDLPYDDGGIAWHAGLVFPGLRRDEHLENEIA